MDTQEFWKALNEGESLDCPCCQRSAKIWRRKIHAGMARVLIHLYKADIGAPGEWRDVKEIYSRGWGGASDYAKLRFWQLIEPSDVRTADENASGLWRITQLGREFVENRVSVPMYIHLFDNEKRGESGQHVSIKDCLGTKFDYASLMAAP